jgi:nitrite reductase (NO-forming)
MTARWARHGVPALLGAAAVAAGALTAVAATAPQTKRVGNAGNEFAFTPKVLRATPGRVRIVFTNSGAVEHDVAVRGGRLKAPRRGRLAGPGGRSVVSFRALPAGRYTYYCTVPGHEAAGMRGRLLVRR